MKPSPVFLALLMAGVMSASAQTVTLQVSYDEVQAERGELYQYSERYLGTKQALTESGTTYVLRSIEIQEPDTARRKPHGGHARHRHEQPAGRPQVQHLPALSEDALLASGTAKKAEMVAKQIYRIRDARMAILSGESDHAPADGKAMELTLRELNRQEEELTALFLGTTSVTPHVKTVEYALPDSVGNEVGGIIMRFSQYAGPVAADDLSGEPVHIVRYNRLAQRPSTHKNAKKGETEIYIYKSRIEILFDGKLLTEYKLPEKADNAQPAKKSK